MDSKEKQMFHPLLELLCVDDYEPDVLEGLDFYARRLASELICDACDYAAHAGRHEIEEDDIKMATELHFVTSARGAEVGHTRKLHGSIDLINSLPHPVESKPFNFSSSAQGLNAAGSATASDSSKRKVENLSENIMEKGGSA